MKLLSLAQFSAHMQFHEAMQLLLRRQPPPHNCLDCYRLFSHLRHARFPRPFPSSLELLEVDQSPIEKSVPILGLLGLGTANCPLSEHLSANYVD